ncbi:hypothetical protein [Acetobacterium wieringae]|uniref:Uncharacterized protein n=1 Tax=Acetobacterium wieringae TaxID=52694 RepID=A0A1F2PGI1_9FIRM|nr:hypothetical protein [Acetobacterium wieringae]OFV70433.1 hypothetical protein ACWI_22140 [Acetobacterium wieringae]
MKSPITMIPGQSQGQPITPLLAPTAVAAVRRFHQSLPDYQPTPLVSLPGLGHRAGDADPGPPRSAGPGCRLRRIRGGQPGSVAVPVLRPKPGRPETPASARPRFNDPAF